MTVGEQAQETTASVGIRSHKRVFHVIEKCTVSYWRPFGVTGDTTINTNRDTVEATM